jgi:aminopeptidase N
MIGMAHDLKKNNLAFTFASPLPLGNGVLHVKFQGSHNNQMAGFYRSGYTDINGQAKVMVSTQFESLDARRCFPCWDEPAAKVSTRTHTHTCRRGTNRKRDRRESSH